MVFGEEGLLSLKYLKYQEAAPIEWVYLFYLLPVERKGPSPRTGRVRARFFIEKGFISLSLAGGFL